MSDPCYLRRTSLALADGVFVRLDGDEAWLL